MANDVLPWLEYRWSFDFPVGMFRAVCERLRGTSARVEELFASHGAGAGVRPETQRWSAQEHAGHLVSVEPLWQRRIEEFLRGATQLEAADMGNRATEEAHYDAWPLDRVLASFRATRAETMRRLDPLSVADAGRVALHPRLNVPMRLVDLCFFAAEHDDHHLALIRAMLAPTASASPR